MATSAPDLTAPVERLHRVLVEEILRNRPEYLQSTFKVAEIYQTLVPYRSHREAVGVEMNGDYEDALLRLLAGAGDLLVLESETAREEIRKELKVRSPNTGLFREFAAAEVRLNQARLPVEALMGGDQATVEVESSQEAVTPARGAVEFAMDPISEVAGPIVAAVASIPSAVSEPEKPAVPKTNGQAEAVQAPAATRRPDLDNCLWCADVLPQRENVNFCPHCGTSAKLKPCRSCGDEMELTWKFCVVCGTESGEPRLVTAGA